MRTNILVGDYVRLNSPTEHLDRKYDRPIRYYKVVSTKPYQILFVRRLAPWMTRNWKHKKFYKKDVLDVLHGKSEVVRSGYIAC